MSIIHTKIPRFGILYPLNTVGIGSSNDLLSFFEAIKLVNDNPVEAFPYRGRRKVCSLNNAKEEQI